MRIPEWFEVYLHSLSDEQAERLWNYFEFQPNTAGAVISAIVASHYNVAVRVCSGIHEEICVEDEEVR